MKNCLIILLYCGLNFSCSNSMHRGVTSRNHTLTIDNFYNREKPVNESVITPSSREVYYYASPDSTSASLGVIPPDTKVRTLSSNGPWYKINYTDSRPVIVLISAMNYRSRSAYLRKDFDITNPAKPSENNQIIQTGPRGGRYYINRNGNKTYIKSK